MVERHLDVARVMGIFPEREERGLLFALSTQAIKAVEQRVGKQPYVLIHPTSRWMFKSWAAGSFRKLVLWLLDRGRRVVISSSSDLLERAFVKQMIEGLPVLDLGGLLSIQELGALVKLADLLVCVDSLPFHIASAFQTKVVALFGPTSEVTWGPWMNPWAKVITKNFSCRPCYLDGCGGSKRSDCLDAITVEEVQEAISALLIHSTLSKEELSDRCMVKCLPK
jgi:heptosyltransferase-3